MEHEMGWSEGGGGDLADSRIGTLAERWTAVAKKTLTRLRRLSVCRFGRKMKEGR